jgi:two-component system cell cycle response regulator
LRRKRRKYKRMRMNNGVWFDTLTGLFNRKYFENELKKELLRATRYDHPLSILMLSIDKFKKIDDGLGHHAADRILNELAQLLKQSVRGVDVLARYSDDEFVMLFPETRKSEAEKIAMRILKNIKNYDFFKYDLKIRELDVSIGMAGFPEDSSSPDDMIEKARKAIDRDKS